MKQRLMLKEIQRTGWVRAGVPRSESVAAHSWGMAMLAMKFCPKHLNRERVLEMCLIHDLAEIIVGDLTPMDDTSTKMEDEEAAMNVLAPEWLSIFQEYECGQTPESKFVKQMDKLDMKYTAENYQEIYGLDLQEFIDSAEEYLSDIDF